MIAGLINEINTLEEQIATAQARLQQLRQVEGITNNALQALQTAVTAIGEMAPSAIENLRDTVLSFFQSFAPVVTPQAEEPIEASPIEFEKQSEPEYLEAPIEDGDKDEDEIAIAYSIPLVPPTPAASATSPTPVALAETVRITHTSPHGSFEVISVSLDVSYCLNKYDSSIQCAYAGFSNKQRAEQWGKYLVAKHVAQGFEVRLAKRLEGFKYELKLWGISQNNINILAKKDLTRVPGQNSISNDTPAASQTTTITEAQARADLGLEPVEEHYYKGDWVNYQGESLMISEVYNNGTLALESSAGTLMIHKSEVELAFRKPNNWQPFGAA